MKIIEFGRDWLLKHVLGKLQAHHIQICYLQSMKTTVYYLRYMSFMTHRLSTFHSWVMTCGLIRGKVLRNS